MSWKGGNTRAVIQDLFGIHTHSLMLAATGMHVGKTTLSLGVFRGLEKKWGHGRVAYCKPLGQRYKDVMLPDGRTIKVRVRVRKGAVAHAAALCVCVCVCVCPRCSQTPGFRRRLCRCLVKLACCNHATHRWIRTLRR
jgi:hypothetical protein